MPQARYRALVEEYFRDHHHAELRATIMNSSGNYSKTFSAADLLPGQTTETPKESGLSLRDALKVAKERRSRGQK